MINIELIRNELYRVKWATEVRGETVDLDQIVELDERHRLIITEGDQLRARRNKVSKDIGRSEEKPDSLVQEMRDVGVRLKELDEEAKSLAQKLESLLLTIPNIPDDNVPEGKSEKENVLVRTEGQLPSFDFDPLPHWELGTRLDIIDLERGAKLSGSRFYVLKGKGATLQRALISWMLDMHTRDHGYQELYLPNMVTRDTAIGSGQLPKFDTNMYHDDEDDLWLVPTAEVPITSLHSGEILKHSQLPFNYVAHTPCFRREKAAAGKDTRGIKRVHQFEKVELFKFVEPESSSEELEKLVTDAERVCNLLEIPYRTLRLCTGELSFTSVKTYDIELWAPGSDDWLEVSSCSNCKDYQARRTNIRYRPTTEARPKFVHTLNGSGLGIPRTIIALMENYQQPDGSIVIPEILRPYTGFDQIG